MDSYTPSPDPELPPAGARRADPTSEPVPVRQALQAQRDAIPPMLQAFQALHAAIPPDSMFNDVVRQEAAPPSPIAEPVKSDIEQQVLIALRNQEWNDTMGALLRIQVQERRSQVWKNCAYADKRGVGRRSLLFTFDGEHLRFNRNESLGDVHV
ncbi:hypothetical protein AMAG_00443 [Allomyces macrogynus ATCC 38327]|uniref:Uncharacterized protein n=1 Tax=Allomyces macrogynus (strain ATCC 38327) TaxID=578462 RepID=A0A0L0RWJ5_ALLM3|nr:hypothetical protein AMAG_00443 [Allomyces macrogynus ATCC 38327]|eukprot:KNE54470.1 hypothetical protein AMAG_00443 [Allomyces macrogynus ATCC 38327]